MDRTCQKCEKEFRDPFSLKRHLAKKLPCDLKLPPGNNGIICQYCNRQFATNDTRSQHIRKSCRAARREADPGIKELAEQVTELSKLVKTGVTTNNIDNSTTVNYNTVVNFWGSPLALTDGDVEASLAHIPGLVGTPLLPEIVDVLMTLVKRAHLQPSGRNVHLSQRRADQALALTEGGWAALPLAEATAALFDGASAQIAAKPAARRKPASPVEQRIQNLRAEVPLQYRRDKENAVQMGMKPMEAHLLNTRPGGPGPLLVASATADAGAGADADADAVAAAVAAASAPAPAPAAAALFGKEQLESLLRDMPAQYTESGAFTRDWICGAVQSGVHYRDLAAAIRDFGQPAEKEGLALELQNRTRLVEPPK
jgi:hypothetical protein